MGGLGTGGGTSGPAALASNPQALLQLSQMLKGAQPQQQGGPAGMGGPGSQGYGQGGSPVAAYAPGGTQPYSPGGNPVNPFAAALRG
jgi:hypothetical protein